MSDSEPLTKDIDEDTLAAINTALSKSSSESDEETVVGLEDDEAQSLLSTQIQDNNNINQANDVAEENPQNNNASFFGGRVEARPVNLVDGNGDSYIVYLRIGQYVAYSI